MGSYDATLRIYTVSADLYFESRLHKVRMAAESTALQVVDHYQGPIFATRFSRDGKWLATASLDNTVCLWDVEKKQRRMQYKHRGKHCCLLMTISDEDPISRNLFGLGLARRRTIRKLQC